MFWISAKLTLVMLCVVPPVSIGAVSFSTLAGTFKRKTKTDREVFYGRYLRKLSNLTQDAIGEMSKVGAYLRLYFLLHPL